MTEALIDRRRRLVRDDLRRVAMTLFAERGFDAVTVDEIAATAGMSPRTFFRYFRTKDELVLDYERRARERLVAALDARPATEGPVTALRRAFEITSHVEPSDRSHVVALGKILQAAPALQVKAHGERVVADVELLAGVAARLGVPAGDQRARTILTAMSAVAAAEFFLWVAEGGQGDPAERIARALALVERGLGELDRPVRRGRR